jgi:Kef-type K+ transport system membrane component KefB
MYAADALRICAELLAVYAGAKLFGRLAARLGQPTVLGELVAGAAIAGLLPFFRPNEPLLDLLSEAGVLLLLFDTGFRCDLDRLLKAGPAAAAVAATGVLAPFLLGLGLMLAYGRAGLEALFVGAALTATSVGLTARVLGDLGKLGTAEAQIILGAAVLDDVAGIGVLSGLQAFAASGAPDLGRLFRMLLLPSAFIGGLLLARTARRRHIERLAQPAVAALAPVFFVMVGAKADFSVFNPFAAVRPQAFGFAALLILAAVAGKLAAGFAAPRKLNRRAIGIGMIPRGEVGLIFAQVGLAAGILEPALYSAVVAMVIVTTFLAPPLLKRSLA